MKTEQILEGNLLIARFMADNQAELEHDLKKAGALESMQYHYQWDWIMPVVIKIGRDFDVDSLLESENWQCMRDACVWDDPESVWVNAIETIKELTEKEV